MAPFVNVEPEADICKLAEAAGATYVARGATFRPVNLEDIIRMGMEKERSFSLKK